MKKRDSLSKKILSGIEKSLAIYGTYHVINDLYKLYTLKKTEEKTSIVNDDEDDYARIKIVIDYLQKNNPDQRDIIQDLLKIQQKNLGLDFGTKRKRSKRTKRKSRRRRSIRL